MIKILAVAWTPEAIDGVSTKFGRTPGGGVPAGVVFGSIPGGSPAIFSAFVKLIKKHWDTKIIPQSRTGARETTL